ncbi:hypothetical protein A2U01_0025403, partial [Trifolium medium]|nr:hypothetical protein [Trifolium medium]
MNCITGEVTIVIVSEIRRWMDMCLVDLLTGSGMITCLEGKFEGGEEDTVLFELLLGGLLAEQVISGMDGEFDGRGGGEGSLGTDVSFVDSHSQQRDHQIDKAEIVMTEIWLPHRV